MFYRCSMNILYFQKISQDSYGRLYGRISLIIKFQGYNLLPASLLIKMLLRLCYPVNSAKFSEQFYEKILLCFWPWKISPLSATLQNGQTQTIRRLLPRNYLSVFNHFLGLALRGLGREKSIILTCFTRCSDIYFANMKQI